jgi:filamentous hemagglutinin
VGTPSASNDLAAKPITGGEGASHKGSTNQGASGGTAAAGEIATPVTSGGTANSASGLGLKKSLASEQQVTQIANGGGNVMAGSGSSVPLRDAPRLAAEYGGSPKDWSKVSSSSYTAADGSIFEVHAYRNSITGQVVEPKTIQPVTLPGSKP